MYKVGIGYTAKGRERWKKFTTIEEANAFCQKVFAASSIVLTIIKE